ncbi:MAG: exo-alpha-sialidase [Runella sp.]
MSRATTKYILQHCYTFLLAIVWQITYAQTVEKQDIFPLQNQHTHGSTLVELPNGDWLVAWFQGSGERTASDVAIMGARQRKGQKNWSKPFVLADVPDFPDINPVLFLDQKQRLWLVWYTVLADQWETSILKYRISTDYLKPIIPKWVWQEDIHVKIGESTPNGIQEGHSFIESVKKKMAAQEQIMAKNGLLTTETAQHLWEKHQTQVLDKVSGREFIRPGIDKNGHKQPMGYPLMARIGWQTRHKPLLIGNRILLPLYSDGFDFSLIAFTDDYGKSWKFSEPIVGIANIQAALLPTQKGEIVAYMRDNGPPPQRLVKSVSTDNGLTWSDVTDSEIPNPGSGADAIRLNNGDWVIVGNDTEVGRHRLAVILSEDEGRTWPYRQYLEFSESEELGIKAHYPAIVQGRDGRLRVSYTFQANNNQKGIRVADFNISWVKRSK